MQPSGIRDRPALAAMPPRADPVLWVAVVLVALGCLHGIDWGRVEPWNTDQMALRELFRNPAAPFHPDWFYRPPFHSYLIHFLVRLPVQLVGEALRIADTDLLAAELVGARMVTMLMLMAIVAIGHRIGRRFFDLVSARILALTLASCAGLVAHAHYLSVDVPLAFWMLAAFYWCLKVLERGSVADYVIAGVLIGIAAATKYNGLAIAASLVLAHVLAVVAVARRPWADCLRMSRIYLGLTLIPVGFLLANPYALLDWERFSADLRFNAWIVPIFDGKTEGTSLSAFLAAFPQLLGWPVTLVTALGSAIALVCLVKRGCEERARLLALLVLVTLLPYAWVCISVPRLEPRFVLPILPLALLLTPFFWRQLIPRWRWALLLALLVYGAVNSWIVGARFLADPRMAAQEWVVANVPDGSVIESTQYAPRWSLLPGVSVRDRRLPRVSGRYRLFLPMVEDDPERAAALRRFVGSDNTRLFSTDRIRRRRPDFLALDSLYYSRFLQPPGSDLYPEMRVFFTGLLAPLPGYEVVLDRSSPPTPVWAYPQALWYLDNRIVILRAIRDDDRLSGSRPSADRPGRSTPRARRSAR